MAALHLAGLACHLFRNNKGKETHLNRVYIVYDLLITHGILFTCRTEPLIQVDISGMCRFVWRIEMEWESRPTGTNLHRAGQVLEHIL